MYEDKYIFFKKYDLITESGANFDRTSTCCYVAGLAALKRICPNDKMVSQL